MNIREFKEGDLITRNEPMTYKHNGSADGSWLGDKMTFLGIDENAKIFLVRLEDKIWKKDEEPHKFSYARDNWDEGWAAYPSSLYEKAKAAISGSSNAKPKN